MSLRRLLAASITVCVLATSAEAAPATDIIGFHAPWDAASLASLKQHGGTLAAVVPAWISVTGPEHAVAVEPDPAGHTALAALKPRPKLWLMVQNARLGAWDSAGAASLLHDAAARAALLDRIEAEGVKEKAAGLVVDLEDLPAATLPDLKTFLTEAKARCGRHGWTLAVTAPPTNPDWDLAALGRAADQIVLMAYDEHWQTGSPGPIASDPWFAAAVKRAIAGIGPGKTIVAVAAYAYDWPAKGPAAVLSIPQAEALAAQNGVKPERDAASGAAHFAYTTGGVAHQVWMSDAATVKAQIGIAEAAETKSVALWRLGTEDPAMWSGR